MTEPHKRPNRHPKYIYGPARDDKGFSKRKTCFGTDAAIYPYMDSSQFASQKLLMNDGWLLAYIRPLFGGRPLALMYYAPLDLIDLSTSTHLEYSQVHQRTVQPICHQSSFGLALRKDIDNRLHVRVFSET